MSLEELRKVKLIDLDTPEMKSRAPAIMQTIQKNGHASFQTNYISKENQVKTIEISVSLFNLNGKTTMLSNIRDITEQKEAESAMNAMVTSIVGTTGTGSLDRIVASVCEWLDADCVMIGGFSPDKEHIRAYSMVFDGKKINDFSFPLKGTPCESTPKEGFSFYPDNVSDNFPDIKNLTGKDFRGYIGAPLKNSEGDVNGVICILSYKPINPTISIQEIIAIIAEKAGADIERAHIEQVLIKNERTLAETMNMANLVSWEYDFETQLFTFDDRFYALYATTAEREGGYMMSAEKYTLEFVYPADIPKVLEEAAKSNEAVDPDFISEFEHRIIRRDGEMRYFSVRVRAVFDEDGKLIKTHGANQDITGQKYIEEALLRANNQLNLLSGITRHDILNNISIFHGYLKLLEIDCDNPEMHGYIRKMTESINKIQYQIEFSRVYQDLGSQKPLWISLDSVLLRTSLPETVHFSGNVSGISVFADPILEKVFYNLLDNSTRHGNNVTEISVFTQEENRSLIIVYEDNGVGIPQEEKEIIFERGYGKNTGHGLFLVREILQLTNISIRETGTFGKGARFEITVPSGLYRKSG
ncbi:MAG: PAS domain-containing protein [Methanomicrobiales archaeon]|nr:PAS domain-containing protein [Methanomicrobiales archaeon]